MSNPIRDQMTQDKKCRICGMADKTNKSIFSRNNDLLAKILTVYPIVIYCNDPLPKHICKKCAQNVHIIYSNLEKVLKTNNKWVENVRSAEPNHIYLTILESIENTNKAARGNIKATFGEALCINSINCFPDLCENSANPSDSSETMELSSSPDNQLEPPVLMVSVPSDTISGQSKHGAEASHINAIKSHLAEIGCTLVLKDQVPQQFSNNTMQETSHPIQRNIPTQTSSTNAPIIGTFLTIKQEPTDYPRTILIPIQNSTNALQIPMRDNIFAESNMNLQSGCQTEQKTLNLTADAFNRMFAPSCSTVVQNQDSIFPTIQLPIVDQSATEATTWPVPTGGPRIQEAKTLTQEILERLTALQPHTMSPNQAAILQATLQLPAVDASGTPASRNIATGGQLRPQSNTHEIQLAPTLQYPTLVRNPTGPTENMSYSNQTMQTVTNLEAEILNRLSRLQPNKPLQNQGSVLQATVQLPALDHNTTGIMRNMETSSQANQTTKTHDTATFRGNAAPKPSTITQTSGAQRTTNIQLNTGIAAALNNLPNNIQIRKSATTSVTNKANVMPRTQRVMPPSNLQLTRSDENVTEVTRNIPSKNQTRLETKTHATGIFAGYAVRQLTDLTPISRAPPTLQLPNGGTCNVEPFTNMPTNSQTRQATISAPSKSTKISTGSNVLSTTQRTMPPATSEQNLTDTIKNMSSSNHARQETSNHITEAINRVSTLKRSVGPGTETTKKMPNSNQARQESPTHVTETFNGAVATEPSLKSSSEATTNMSKSDQARQETSNHITEAINRVTTLKRSMGPSTETTRNTANSNEAKLKIPTAVIETINEVTAIRPTAMSHTRRTPPPNPSQIHVDDQNLSETTKNIPSCSRSNNETSPHTTTRSNRLSATRSSPLTRNREALQSVGSRNLRKDCIKSEPSSISTQIQKRNSSDTKSKVKTSFPNVRIKEIINVKSKKSKRNRPSRSDNFKCQYCSLEFLSLQMLVTHEVTHLRLKIPRLFAKKCLPKTQRRGRLIKVRDRDCIRCLNCWCVFTDNKTVLDHWALGNCDYYCHICKKDFAQTPKMLREHVPAAHGISFRSSRQLRINLTKEQNTRLRRDSEPSTSKSQQVHTPHKKPSTYFDCPICLRVFNTTKGRNLHMRLHRGLQKIAPDTSPVEHRHTNKNVSPAAQVRPTVSTPRSTLNKERAARSMSSSPVASTSKSSNTSNKVNYNSCNNANPSHFIKVWHINDLQKSTSQGLTNLNLSNNFGPGSVTPPSLIGDSILVEVKEEPLDM